MRVLTLVVAVSYCCGMSEPATARVGRMGGLRARARSTRVGRVLWRIGVTVLGVLVVAIGIVLLPLPGPGWVIIFGGLGILATEYAWAARLLRWVRRFVTRMGAWVKARGLFLQIVFGVLSVAFLAAVVLGAWWLYREF